ncbi:MAG: sulfotransferase family 2 domain-containing protein [Saprospiraceae bacterium]
MSLVSDNLKCIFFDIPKTGGSSIEKLLISYGQAKPFGRHQTPSWVRNHGRIHPTNWDKYLKFSFIRNPLSRTYSIYSYYKMGREHTSFDPELLPDTFEGFVMDLEEYLKVLGLDYNQIKWFDEEIDFIGRFDYLQKDINTIFDILSIRVDIAHDPILPHINQSKKNEKYYHDAYTKEMSRIVLDYFFNDVVYMYKNMDYTKTHFDISVNLDFS